MASGVGSREGTSARNTWSVPPDYAWLLGISFLFGLSNTIGFGHWEPTACALLAVALGFLVWRFVVAVRGPSGDAPAGADWRVPGAVFAMLLSMPLSAFFRTPILAAPVHPLDVLRFSEVASVVLIASYLPFSGPDHIEKAWVRNVRFAAFALVLLVAGVAIIHITPAPAIDVWTIQIEGGKALLAGKNPYVWATVPDTDPENSFTVPFVYPPTIAYLAAVGVAVFKDVRYVLLGAMFVAGLALRFIARRAAARSKLELPSLLEDAPALFFWQTPLLAVVVELSWVDPIQVMFISAGVAAFVADRKTLAAVLFGVAVSSKQSMFWLLPLVGVVLRFDLRRWIVLSVAALVPVVPFLLWDFKALKHANFEFMSGLPPRRDALCFTNAVWKLTGASFPASSAFLLAALTVGVACLRALPPTFPLVKRLNGGRRSGDRPALDFSRALVLTYFVFFYFNRWAFANYYFLLTGLAAMAGAAALQRPEQPSAPEQAEAA
jgi:hypothetical protein